MRLDSPQRRAALPQIAQKNPTRTSLEARVKSYLFHLYWNEAGPFNETDVAVISSDRTTRGNDASLLCYLSSERVPVWIKPGFVIPQRAAFRTCSPDGWERMDYIFLFLNEVATPPVCCSNSSYRSKACAPSWFPHIQYFSTIKLDW